MCSSHGGGLGVGYCLSGRREGMQCTSPRAFEHDDGSPLDSVAVAGLAADEMHAGARLPLEIGARQL